MRAIRLKVDCKNGCSRDLGQHFHICSKSACELCRGLPVNNILTGMGWRKSRLQDLKSTILILQSISVRVGISRSIDAEPCFIYISQLNAERSQRVRDPDNAHLEW